MSSTSVNNDHIKPFFLKLGYSLRSDGYRIGFGIRAKVGDFGFGGRLTGLVECSCSKRIGADNSRFESSALVVDSKLEMN